MTPPARVDGPFERLFWTDQPDRDNYRARLFAIFSEEIVRIWSRNERAPYIDIGRPTLWRDGVFATVDFAFERRSDRALFVAEQKAELTWQSYGQLRLKDRAQVDHHRGKPAFDWFLDIAMHPSSSLVKVKGRPRQVAGAILVWGAVDSDRRETVRDAFGFADIVTVEEALADLRRWQDPAWQARVDQLRAWTEGLWDALEGSGDAWEVSGGA